MSRKNRERRQKAADALPPVNRVPLNLPPGFARIIEYGVGAWTPELNGKGELQAVVLHFTLDLAGAELQCGIRLKSPRAVDELIAMLDRHRNDVWPGAV